MHIIITKGMEFGYFSRETLDRFQRVIGKEIEKVLNQQKKPEPIVFGGFVLKDIDLIDGRKMNVWIEYNGKILSSGLIDTEVHNCIIYDEIPDIVLDRLNVLNQVKAQSEEAKKEKSKELTAFEKFKEELEPYKDTLVIDLHTSRVSRLVDVFEGEDDCYWIYNRQGVTYNTSCFIEWVPLKGIIDQKKYERMVHVWNLNNAEKAI